MDADKIHNTAMEYALDPTEEKLEAAVIAALPLTQTIAARFSGRGVEMEDLRQVGAMALVEALKRFEPERGLRFTTYVTPTITGKVRNYIRDRAQLMRSPRGLREQGIKMDRANEALIQTLRREPSVQELSNYLGWSVQQVLDVQQMRDKTTIASLDMPDEDGLLLFDRIGEDDISFENFESREDLRKALASLSDVEKQLLMLRFSRRLSQSVVARQLGLTQMQVSRMERRTLATLKREMSED